MRIVFDVSPLSHLRTGVGNYVLGSLRGLVAAAGRRHEVVAFAPVSVRGKRQVEESLADLDVERRLPVLPLAHGWRTAWSRLQRPAAERWLGTFDVLHFSDWMYPPQRAGVRATTIHDLVPLRFPGWTHGRTVKMHGAKYRNASRTAHLFMCNSEYTANDVQKLLGVDRERIRVAYPGYADVFSPKGERADLGQPYVLVVGSADARKNVSVLLRMRLAELTLAFAGTNNRILDTLGIALGYVSDEELAALYRGAEVFAYPSRFEGFGIPILEAMASGVPVVASSHSSLDEASGDAALRADPDRPEDWSEAIREARRRRNELVEKGLAHAARFSWRRQGELFLAAYEEALARISA